MGAMLPCGLATFRRMRIAHLSDLHLTRGPLAAQPAAALADALARLLAMEPRPDCVIITGDLADTGHPDEYATLRAILRYCPLPVHLLPGNHDDPAALAAVIRKHPHVVRVLAGHVHRDASALFAGTLMATAPSTYRQAALRLHDAEPPGYVAEPTSFLLHVLDGTRCVTHSVAVSHAAAVRAF